MRCRKSGGRPRSYLELILLERLHISLRDSQSSEKPIKLQNLMVRKGACPRLLIEFKPDALPR